jgi:hypothetical protein
MSTRLWLAKVLPFFVISGALAAATLLGDYALHRFGLAWLGRYLGIPGVVLIALSMIYSLRKRKRIAWGRPTMLLAFHEISAWLGSLLVLLHAGIHFNSLLAWLAALAMCINVLSGLVGKLLLASSRQVVNERLRQLQAEGRSPDEIEAELFWDRATVRVMNQWRKVHIPVFVAFVALALAHSVSALLFWSWQ